MHKVIQPDTTLSLYPLSFTLISSYPPSLALFYSLPSHTRVHVSLYKLLFVLTGSSLQHQQRQVRQRLPQPNAECLPSSAAARPVPHGVQTVLRGCETSRLPALPPVVVHSQRMQQPRHQTLLSTEPLAATRTSSRQSFPFKCFVCPYICLLYMFADPKMFQ